MSLGRREAYELFRRDYEHNDTIESNKQTLKRLCVEAKQLGEQLADSRNKISTLAVLYLSTYWSILVDCVDCVVVCPDIQLLLVIFHVFLFSGNAVLQLHTDVFTFLQHCCYVVVCRFVRSLMTFVCQEIKGLLTYLLTVCPIWAA